MLTYHVPLTRGVNKHGICQEMTARVNSESCTGKHVFLGKIGKWVVFSYTFIETSANSHGNGKECGVCLLFKRRAF